MKQVVLLIFSILIITSLAIISLVVVKQESIKNAAIDCYQEVGQCGLHNILEESELEDESIDFNIVILETEMIHLDEKSRNKGLMILKYLKSLSYQERQEFIISVWREVSDE